MKKPRRFNKGIARSGSKYWSARIPVAVSAIAKERTIIKPQDIKAIWGN